MSVSLMSHRWLNYSLGAVLVMTLAPAVALAQGNSQTMWADTVVASNGGSSSAGSPSDALGDTPGTYFTLGDGGSITVAFAQDFSTSGDNSKDIYIDEYGNTDCYYICLSPADNYTAQALQNAGLTQFGNLYQLPTKYCGPVSIDIDKEVQNHAAGQLCFDALMVEDDGNGSNGAEVVRLRADFICMPPPPPPSGGPCQPEFASEIVAFHLGSNQTGTTPDKILGDTNKYHNLGDGGWVTVGFSQDFSTSGDANADLCIDEYGNVDCYLICLVPADANTTQALQAAGIPMVGTNLYQLPQTFCGTTTIDLDSFIPGFSEGDLRFSEVMIEDDGDGSNGAEIIKVEAKFVCPPPPPPGGPCGPEFASIVVDFMNGANHTGTDPNDALGNDPNTYHNLGDCGYLTLAFSASFSTSGDSGPDILIDEWGDVDCYDVCLNPANAATAQALQAAGLTQVGSYYQIPQQYCGTDTIDIDAFVPGFATLQLLFSDIQVKDACDGGNGAEVARLKAEYVCSAVVSVCAPGWLSTVLNSVPGPGSSGTDPNDILGDTPGTCHSLGEGGCIDVTFANIFTTTGDGGQDLFFDEYNVVDCYGIGLKPADADTATALAAAGFLFAEGFYGIPTSFCGDQAIDIDLFAPGYASGDLRFTELRIKDDGSAGDGAEICRVEATLVCDFAKLGDRVWVDVNCDGIQDANEIGLAGIGVTLYDDSGTVALQQTTTEFGGKYCFYVAPGAYRIGFSFDPNQYFATTPGAGSDPELDSDIDSMGMTAPFSVMGGQQKLDIDAGLCLICTGITAFVDLNLPGCGDPLDPVMTAPAPALGSIWTLTLNTQFPNAIVSIFLQAGPPTPGPVPGFPSPCTLWVDPFGNPFPLVDDVLDANGDYTVTIPIPVAAALIGYEATLQARVCEPSIPGPILGFPDWLSNGVHIIIGCP